jgi:prepilin-type N-terminal cleavage/methylation domain-containing protein
MNLITCRIEPRHIGEQLFEANDTVKGKGNAPFKSTNHPNGGGQSCNLSSANPGREQSGEITGTDIFYVPVLRPRCAESQRRGARRQGFTLVEVIVVIVIIAILAAIGVPALTGYIDKAQDRQYIAQTRDVMVATRTVIDEAYANGELNIEEGHAKSGISAMNLDDTKYWSVMQLSEQATGNKRTFLDRISALIGKDYEFYINDGDFDNHYITVVGPANTSVLNADGIYCNFIDSKNIIEEAPNGYRAYPATVVTYKIADKYGMRENAFPASALDSNSDSNSDETVALWQSVGDYDPNSGYEIYYSWEYCYL